MLERHQRRHNLVQLLMQVQMVEGEMLKNEYYAIKDAIR
jgi:hypothetical protein